jgi:hypothetical protein
MSVKLGIPLLIQEEWLRHQEKDAKPPSGADGVVGIDEVFQNAFLEEVPFWTTINASPYRARASRPSAPLKEASRLLLDVAATPRMSGGEWHARFHASAGSPHG